MICFFVAAKVGNRGAMGNRQSAIGNYLIADACSLPKTKAPEKSGAFSFQLKPTIRKTFIYTVCFFSFLNTSQQLVPFDFSMSL
jgi:hypothetical protein